MLKNSKKGFTLIELLVVIAIIGILSSVVLASLNSARDKGADAAIKSNLTNIGPQAQIYYDDNENYGADVSDCTGLFAYTNIADMIASAQIASGPSVLASCATDDGDVAVGSAATSWAVAVPLKTDSAKSWCVDNTGASKEITGVVVLNSNVASCL